MPLADSSPPPVRLRDGGPPLTLDGPTRAHRGRRAAWPWLLLTALAAGLGSLGSADAPAFYALLQKPDWAPPSSVFGPVWTVLYLLMAIGAALVARQPADHLGARRRRWALGFFAAQLAANAAWSWCFFAWRQGGAGLAVAALMWALLAVSVVLFARVRPLSAWLLGPTLAWASFAVLLNASVWMRNPALLG